MIEPGLVSITFRKNSPADIIEWVRRAGLSAIEWGGDIHVPHGDTGRAAEVARMTRDAGLRVACYGSYYRCGVSEGEGLAFDAVLDTARALGAPRIRVWAGKGASASADPAAWAAVIEDARRIADRAAAAGLEIAFEYHANTLTDTPESARRLLDALPHPAIRTLWQPPNGMDDAGCAASLKSVLPRLAHLHVFHWSFEGGLKREALAAGAARWRPWIEIVRSLSRAPEALIEFVRGDSAEAFLEDAATLRSWLAG